MKKYFPYIAVGVSILFVVVGIVLRQGTADADTAVTNITSSFLFIAAGICFVVGIVTYLLRHDDEVW